MRVRDVLKSKGGRVISIGGTAPVAEAVALMVQNNIGSLPVTADDGSLVGIFSERDALRLVHKQGEGHGQLLIRDVMTPNPVTCDLDDEVDCVMGQMSDRRIAKVPVLSSGVLVGIISVGDMIKLMYERVRSENHHLMSYIHGSYRSAASCLTGTALVSFPWRSRCALTATSSSASGPSGAHAAHDEVRR
ncbi:MAG: CBS domain-containing protein [Isosphaeraceae bacterium]